MNPDPIAVRVARRHRAAVVVARDVPPKTRVDLDCSGAISASRLRMELEPVVGYLAILQFRASSEGSPDVGWEAVTGSGDTIIGTLVVRTVVTTDEVVSWAEVTVDRA